ncbi:type II toxin-antitoxin system HicB family antitoxin [Moraxella sp. ZJ142]|uniref:type II toxin-antitoxin system HicB family antitoxin n=1 Tax=Moraxella marmotae TaxID=3344520 RepID=UPI0035D45C58
MLYPVAIEKEVINGKAVYGVVVPDLLGCVSVGDSYSEACHNIAEAISLHLDGMAQDGDDIPMPKSIDDYIHHPDYAGMYWAMVEIDLTPYLGKAEKLTITLPQSLLYRIDQKILANKSYYKSRSNYLAQLALADLG